MGAILDSPCPSLFPLFFLSVSVSFVQYFETKRIDGLRPNFVYALLLTRSTMYVGIVNHHFFLQIWNRFTALDSSQNLVFAQYLENKLTEWCTHIINDKIYVCIVNHCFSQICNRVITLDSHQNLVFIQYLEKN